LISGEKTVNLAVFYLIGIALIIVGLIVIVVTIVTASISGLKKSKVRDVGVIIIGPIPIIFGTDKKSVKTILLLALSISIIVLIIMVVNYWLLR